MFNILLDKLPNEYDGYLIRTDFRIGMQIDMCLKDMELNEDEKIGICLNLLYGRGCPQDIDKALNGLSWFVNCGVDKLQEEQEEEGKQPIFDFDIDSGRIYSAFKKVYNIDLSQEKIHWFKFVAMLGDVGECAFTNVINYRTADLTNMTGKMRDTYAKMKRKFALPDLFNDEEKEKIAEFCSKIGVEEK